MRMLEEVLINLAAVSHRQHFQIIFRNFNLDENVENSNDRICVP